MATVNQWLSLNSKRIDSVRKFLVESSFQDSGVLPEVKTILYIIDNAILEIGKLQRENSGLKYEISQLKVKQE
jgi:hypothetical protein